MTMLLVALALTWSGLVAWSYLERRACDGRCLAARPRRRLGTRSGRRTRG